MAIISKPANGINNEAQLAGCGLTSAKPYLNGYSYGQPYLYQQLCGVMRQKAYAMA
jgi:hypothetical protein